MRFKLSFSIKRVMTVSLLLFIIPGLIAADNPKPRLSVNYPAQSNAVLSNPYIGLVGDAGDPDGVKQKVTLVQANLSWRELEPERGVYDFVGIEEKFNFDHWRKTGVRIILRVVLDYPSTEIHRDIPDWLYDKINGQGTAYDHAYGKGFSPDYTNQILIKEHERLIQAVAQRYNTDPFVVFIQLGSVGHWGEWHTMDNGPGYIPFPSSQVTDRYVTPYLCYFTEKKLLMRRPMQIAAANNMGLFNDAFGDHASTVDGFYHWVANGYTSWLTQEEEPAMPEFWATAPSGGEFLDAERYVSDAAIEDTLAQVKLTHVSWLGPAAPWSIEPGSVLQKNVDRLVQTMGYRFSLNKAVYEQERRPGETLHTRIIVENKGVAPFYYRWPLEISIADSEGHVQASIRSSTDIRTWQPGLSEAVVHLKIPKKLAVGTYTVQASILDPSTGKPGVDFANTARQADGRYVLGKVKVQ